MAVEKIVFDFKPSEKQAEFFMSRAKFTAYGGARGGGKSFALRYKLIFMCLKYPGIRALLIRRTYPELRENHIRPLTKLLCGENSLAVYSERDKSFDFKNGSRLKMGYLSGEADLLQYQGQEFDIIAIDEATQISEHSFSVLTAALRGADPFPKRMYLTCNPGGIGHGWVKRLFIDREYRESEVADDYAFIPARIYDNKALMESDPGYIKQLECLPNDLKKAWLDGCWNVFSGQFFSEFRYDIHVCEPTDIGDARRYCAIDYGLDMFAAVFVAVDFDGKAYVYDEIYESGLIVSRAAELLKKKLCDGMTCIAPADLWARQKDSGLSVAEIFAREGVYFTKISPDRIGGFAAMKEWLHVDEGESKMVIFKNCKELIRTLPLLMYDTRRPGDASSEPHEITHAPDALRYFCSANPLPAERRVPKRFIERMGERRKRAVTQ